MRYIIQTEIKDVRYYLQTDHPKYWHAEYKWEGLINNATIFTKEEAEKFVKSHFSLKDAEIVPYKKLS